MNQRRRRVLRALGAVGLGTGVAGCVDTPGLDRPSDQPPWRSPVGTPGDTPTETPTETPAEPTATPNTRYGIRFDRVVDAVDDLGMDPNGNNPVQDALASAYEPGTVVEFPPGTYLVTRELGWDENLSRFGVVGAGDSHTDVQFVFPKGNDGREFRLFDVRSGSHHLFANFSIQQTGDDRTTADMVLVNDDGARIQDVEWLGRTPIDDYAKDQLLTLSTETVEGVTVVRRVFMREGAALPGYPDGIAGIRVVGRSIGEVRLEDCHIEQRGSSSFRATHTRGAVRVVGGLFKNNDNTNMRISGGNHPTKNSVIRGATVVVDADNLNEHAREGDRLTAPEGLRVDATGQGYSGLLVEDCDFRYRSSPSSIGIVTCPTWGGHGGFTMRNCRIHNETNVQTISIEATDTSVAERPWGVTLENLLVSGTSRSQPDGAVIFIDDDRHGSTVANSCISFPNGRFGGVRIRDSRNCTIQDTNINVAGQSTDFVNAPVTTTNLSFRGSCGSELPGS